MISGWMKTRARFLEQGIGRLLGNDGPDQSAVRSSPYPHSGGERRGRQPILHSGGAGSSAPLRTCSPGPANRPRPGGSEASLLRGQRAAQRRVDGAARRPGMDAAAVRALLEKWFDDGMARVTAGTKRNSQRNALILACLITVALNADTLKIRGTSCGPVRPARRGRDGEGAGGKGLPAARVARRALPCRR